MGSHGALYTALTFLFEFQQFHKVYFWGPGLAWSKSRKIGWLDKNHKVECISVIIPYSVICSVTILTISYISSDLTSLDFVVNRFFMKLFKTTDINVVETCQQYFSFCLPSDILQKPTIRNF